MHVRLGAVLDRLVSTPSLVRKLKAATGTIKVKDGGGVVHNVGYERTQAGYINFTHADETVKLKVPRAAHRG